MKKGTLIFLCALLFILAAGAGAAWLYFSPAGSLNPHGPDAAVQAYVDGMDLSQWREAFCRLCRPEVTKFENAEEIAGLLFDQAAAETGAAFRRDPEASSRGEPAYIFSINGYDLFTAPAVLTEGGWEVGELAVPESLLVPEGRTVTITVPENAAVTVNGVPLGTEDIRQDNVPYEDLTVLESRFDPVPHRVEYALDGIFSNVQVDVSRDGGAVLLYADGTDWSYTVPDAGAYSFRVMAPAGAIVTVCGAQLGPEEALEGSYAPEYLVDVPADAQLPDYTVYQAQGLYSQPEISARMADGTALAASQAQDGTLLFSAPGSEDLALEHSERVESFLTDLCEYSAGHLSRGYPQQYAVPDSALYQYIRNASSSLYWMVGVSLTFQEVSSSDYVSLGDGSFLCRGHVECTTETRYQTKELDLDYQMLWVYQSGQWLIADLAFL